MKKLLFALFALTVVFTSCKNDDELLPNCIAVPDTYTLPKNKIYVYYTDFITNDVGEDIHLIDATAGTGTYTTDLGKITATAVGDSIKIDRNGSSSSGWISISYTIKDKYGQTSLSTISTNIEGLYN